MIEHGLFVSRERKMGPNPVSTGLVTDNWEIPPASLIPDIVGSNSFFGLRVKLSLAIPQQRLNNGKDSYNDHCYDNSRESNIGEISSFVSQN